MTVRSGVSRRCFVAMLGAATVEATLVASRRTAPADIVALAASPGQPVLFRASRRSLARSDDSGRTRQELRVSLVTEPARRQGSCRVTRRRNWNALARCLTWLAARHRSWGGGESEEAACARATYFARKRAHVRDLEIDAVKHRATAPSNAST